MAIKTLCEAGLKVCALNAGRQVDPAQRFPPASYALRHEVSRLRLLRASAPSVSVTWTTNMSRRTHGSMTLPIPPAREPGGPGRRSKRRWRQNELLGPLLRAHGEIDFKAASRDGYDVDWPVTYDEMAPYYTRVERDDRRGQHRTDRPSNPDGKVSAANTNFVASTTSSRRAPAKLGIPYLPDRIAQLTLPSQGHPPCHYCGNCTDGCDVGAFFSSPYFLLPLAHATGNLELRTNAIAREVLVDAEGRAKGVAYVDRVTRQEVEVYGRAVVVAASCISTAQIMLNSRSPAWPTGIANSSGQVGRNLCDHLYGTTGFGYLPQLLGQPSFPDNVSAAPSLGCPAGRTSTTPGRRSLFAATPSIPVEGATNFPATTTTSKVLALPIGRRSNAGILRRSASLCRRPPNDRRRTSWISIPSRRISSAPARCVFTSNGMRTP